MKLYLGIAIMKSNQKIQVKVVNSDSISGVRWVYSGILGKIENTVQTTVQNPTVHGNYH